MVSLEQVSALPGSPTSPGLPPSPPITVLPRSHPLLLLLCPLPPPLLHLQPR